MEEIYLPDDIIPHKDKLINIIKECSFPMDPVPTGSAKRIIPMADIRAVVFDIYGTLFISGSGDIGTVSAAPRNMLFEKAVTQSGGEIISRETGSYAVSLLTSLIKESHRISKETGMEYPEVKINSIWKELISSLSENGFIKIPENRLWFIYLSLILFECYANPVWPMPGMEETIEILGNKNKLLGIISNAQFYTPLLFPALTGRSLTGYGFDQNLVYFSFMRGISKPSTAIFTDMITLFEQNYGITGTQILYVGNDMLNDVYSAGRAGMKTCLFAGDKRSLRARKEIRYLEGIEPDLIITSLPELLEAV